LHYRQRTYGVLVIATKESAAFVKKEKTLIESAGQDITKALERESLFDSTVLLSRPFVAQEPAIAGPTSTEQYASPPSHASPEREAEITPVLSEAAQIMPFDRAWVTYYDPLAGAVEVLGIAGEKGEHKTDLKPGQRLALDASASGWAVRHRKPRLDHDLASTQGRFLDHKHLYKDRFRSAMVVPFFVRGQVGGTITLASKTPMQYTFPDAKTLEPLIAKLGELLQQPASAQVARPSEGSPAAVMAAPALQPPSEPLIRKQERQAAIGEFSAFLATEVREPLASIRAQLEEITGEGILDFDPQTRVENAMRDLIRVEAILNEILDFAKPLELNRRVCRVPDIIETALTVVATELESNRIRVTKDYIANLNQVRCDETKMQQVFLSIFKNALEAMTPGGHLHIEVTQHRAGRHPDLQILIKNDGVPIPTEYVGKVFEPYFTTKQSGTGLGLATVKKIVEEHQGQISIASGPGQGTAVIIRLPAWFRAGAFRHRGRRRRPPRPR
ncbi:MAG TPA: ATP-binding protein, partial [Nitrospiraceae bacterium]|nr:ATP-binding protein [Nitrospiraceae bacterium]